jgi:hypothetical protein
MPVISELTFVAVHPIGLLLHADDRGDSFGLGPVVALAFTRSAPLASLTCHVASYLGIALPPLEVA